MIDNPFDISKEDPHYLMKRRLNMCLRGGAIPRRLDDFFERGGVMGDIKWRIHQWSLLDFEEDGVEKFDGWRIAVGWEEYSGTEVGPDKECIVDEETFWSYVRHVCFWNIEHYPQHAEKIRVAMKKHKL